MLLCPYCEQENVWEIELRPSNRRAVMCFECDTVWESTTDVKDGKGVRFEDYMTKLGLPADWKLAEKLKQI